MRIRIFLLAAVMALTLTACSNIKDTKFTDTNREEVIEKILQSEDLSESDKVKLTLVIGRAQALGEKLEGKTVGDLLAESEDEGEEAE